MKTKNLGLLLKWQKPKAVWHKHQDPNEMMEARIEIGKHLYIYAEVYKPTAEFGDDFVCRVSFNTYVKEFGASKKTMQDGILWAESIITKELVELNNGIVKIFS